MSLSCRKCGTWVAVLTFLHWCRALGPEGRVLVIFGSWLACREGAGAQGGACAGLTLLPWRPWAEPVSLPCFCSWWSHFWGALLAPHPAHRLPLCFRAWGVNVPVNKWVWIFLPIFANMLGAGNREKKGQGEGNLLAEGAEVAAEFWLLE